MSDPRYPIGEFTLSGEITPARRDGWIAELSDAPGALRALVQGMDPATLDTPYREGGWTVRQVVHHLPDSHLNAYVRFKLALTEDNPTIVPYQEGRWALLPDTRTTPVGVSLTLLDALHRRWVALLRGMAEADWSRTFFHPEHGKAFRLDAMLAHYAWHGKHHIAQVAGVAAPGQRPAASDHR